MEPFHSLQFCTGAGGAMDVFNSGQQSRSCSEYFNRPKEEKHLFSGLQKRVVENNKM